MVREHLDSIVNFEKKNNKNVARMKTMHTFVFILILSLVCTMTSVWWVKTSDRRIQSAKVSAQKTSQYVLDEWNRLLKLKAWKEQRDHLARQSFFTQLETMFENIQASNELSPFEKLGSLLKLYKRGFYPYIEPDNDMATKCARCIIKYAPMHMYREKYEAQQILLDDSVNNVDISRDSISPYSRYGDACIEECMRVSTKERVMFRLRREPDEPVAPRTENTRIENDPQNSHDHSVVRSIRKKMEGFSEYPESKHESTKQNIHEYIIACDLNDDVKIRAIETLSSLDTETRHPTLKMTENDILVNVWENTNVKDNVIIQLAECVEHGNIVCHTGKCGRLVSALDTAEGEIQPMWAIKQKLMNRAMKIRTEVLSSSGQQQRSMYENGTDTELQRKMIERFERDAREDIAHLDSSIQHSVLNEMNEAF